MAKIQIDGPDGPEDVHLLQEEAIPKNTTPQHEPMKTTPFWPIFLLGIALGAMLTGLWMGRYEIRSYGASNSYLYRVDRITGQVEMYDRKNHTWIGTWNLINTSAPKQDINEAIDAVIPSDKN